MEIENTGEHHLKLGAHRLPDVKLPSSPGGSPAPIRPPGRVSPVLVLLDGAERDACRAYLRLLASASADIAEWDGRVIVVAPASPEDAARISADASAFTLLADPDQTLAARLSLSTPALVIADPYGEIHHAVSATAAHDLPSLAEIIDWLRYLAIQCPECQGEAL
jgi:hypothetical protein